MAFIKLSSTTTDNRRKELVLVRNLKIIDKSFVLVGIFKDAGTYPNSPHAVAQIAFWNEFGTRTIPSRPWIRSSIDENLGKINKESVRLKDSILSNKKSPKEALDSLGFRIQQIFRNKIQKSRSWAVPNAPSTTRAKLRGGALRGPTPLIKTGRMLRSVQFKSVVR